MSATRGADSSARGVRHDDPVDPHYVIPAVLAALVVAVVAGLAISLGGGASDRLATGATRTLPAYWTVHRGDSYSVIARRTGLTVDDLETFNPYTNPATIRPGQRLKLRLDVPRPKPRPKGPVFHEVRSGETLSSIAARTHHDVADLLRLNPRRNPTALQPGDRLRLRR